MGRRIDLSGHKFGKLTAISYETVKQGDRFKTIWLCKCDCGNTIKVPIDRLRNGAVTDCGIKCKLRKPKPKKDLTGKRFGKLIAVEYLGKSEWKCVCDCGNEHIVKTNYLTSGDTKSCGKCSKAIDMVGKRFGKLTVLRRAEDRISKRGDGVTIWECQCDCGRKVVTTRAELIRGHKKDCGCSKDYHELVGEKIGRLTVKKIIPSNVYSSYIHAECVCECGKITHPQARDLVNGKIKSCGCLSLDKIHEKNKKHNMSGSQLHNVWKGINQRCNNPNSTSYKNYGGRGISICEEWSGEHGFENFYKWAVEAGYDESKSRAEQSIDRIDVNGNYEPSNCRWADIETQSYNKTNTTTIEVFGEKLNVKEISEKYKIPKKTIRARIYQGNVKEDRLLYKGNLGELK